LFHKFIPWGVKALKNREVNIHNDDTNFEPMIKIPSSAFGALRRLNPNEAKEHIKLFGYSEEPVCHSLAGYASGCLL
jgi:hypothetical protein